MKIAIIEGSVIDPSRDAGSQAIFDLQSSLCRLAIESKIFYVGEKLRKQLENYGANVLIVSRPDPMARSQDFRARFKVPIIYWAQDLHSRRISLYEKLTSAPAQSSLSMAFMEKIAISSADIAVFPTGEDVVAARRKYILENIVHHPYFSFTDSGLADFSERKKNLVFIGSSQHLPNLDGLVWFLDSCWSLVREKENKSQLWVIGDWEDNKTLFEKYPGVRVTGKITEENVQSVMQSSLIGIAPLRFGAGLKRKTLQYLHSGLVTVSTDFGLAGLNKDHDDTCWRRANEPADFVNAILQVFDTPQEAAKMSEAGRKYVLSEYSAEIFDAKLQQILNTIIFAPTPKFSVIL